jgi:hypothetical protein
MKPATAFNAFLVLLTLAGNVRAEEPAVTLAAIPVSDADRERFLLEGVVIRTRSAPSGVTDSTRATLRLGSFEHDAHIQTIDEKRNQVSFSGGDIDVDFRDSYRNNVAAYRLDRLLGLGMVPVTVVRSHQSRKAAFTWWVDDVLFTEKERKSKKQRAPDLDSWNREMLVVHAFDELIYNVDRNLGNLLFDAAWRVWMIDHTRAFKIWDELGKPERLGTRCPRALLPALRRLDETTLVERMKDLLSPGQVRALLARRDVIVRYYEGKVQELGEEAVLYDLPARLTASSP